MAHINAPPHSETLIGFGHDGVPLTMAGVLVMMERLNSIDWK
jgi:hypothetical protein